MTNSSVTGGGTGAYRGGIPLNVTLHAWPIPRFNTNLKPINVTHYPIDKSSESAKNYTSSLHNLNATGYVAIDDDLIDTGLTDVQTFILAGVATVIPLVVIVVTILGIRFLWRRYRAKKEDGYEGVLQKEESSEPLGKLQSYSLPQELKTSESQFTVTQGEDLSSTPSTQLLTPKSNGSVITMTLKNNHLIVETEETTVSTFKAENNNTSEGIKIESKGTTTKFVTVSKVPDFSFDGCTENPADCNKESSVLHSLEQDGIPPSADFGALVHCAPEETEDEFERGSCNTGLSQSDLSLSSTDSRNPSYRYGNQMGYDSGGYGYPEYSGYSTFSNIQSNLSQTGPKIHKIYTRGYMVTEQVDSYVTNSRTGGKQLKDILMSDIQAREKREHDENCKEQNILGNGNASDNNATEVLSSNNPYPDQSALISQSKELQRELNKNDILQLNKNEYSSNNGVFGEEGKS